MNTLRINAPSAKLFARLVAVDDGVRVTFWQAASDNTVHQMVDSETFTDRPFHVVADHVHTLLQDVI